MERPMPGRITLLWAQGEDQEGALNKDGPRRNSRRGPGCERALRTRFCRGSHRRGARDVAVPWRQDAVGDPSGQPMLHSPYRPRSVRQPVEPKIEIPSDALVIPRSVSSRKDPKRCSSGFRYKTRHSESRMMRPAPQNIRPPFRSRKAGVCYRASRPSLRKSTGRSECSLRTRQDRCNIPRRSRYPGSTLHPTHSRNRSASARETSRTSAQRASDTLDTPWSDGRTSRVRSTCRRSHFSQE